MIRTHGVSTSIVGVACRFTKHHWTRVRMSLLIPLALGACALSPATSSLLQAKEISMQDNQGQYQPYTPGMKLPEGVFPPMQGYTHEDLVGAAGKRAEAVLKEAGVDPTLARESLFALAQHLNQALEAQNVEYQIATWYKKPYENPADRSKSVADMAESFGALAVRATTESLKGSPLLDMDKTFLRNYISSAGDGVHDLIATLNKPGA